MNCIVYFSFTFPPNSLHVLAINLIVVNICYRYLPPFCGLSLSTFSVTYLGWEAFLGFPLLCYPDYIYILFHKSFALLSINFSKRCKSTNKTLFSLKMSVFLPEQDQIVCKGYCQQKYLRS